MLAFLWLLVWLALFADCLRTQRLRPLAGSTRRARILWSLSFLLANPILALLYLMVGRAGRLYIERPQLRVALGTAGAAVALWLQFIAGSPGSADVITAGHNSGISFSANSHWHQASSTSIARPNHPGPAIGPSKVRVVYTDDALSHTIAKQVAEAIADKWWTGTVQLWPRGRTPKAGGLAPDRYIDIDASDVTVVPAPLIQVFHGRVLCHSSEAPSHMGAWPDYDMRIQLGQFEVDSDLELSFLRIGTALGESFYGEPARVISDSLVSSLIDELNQKANAFGILEDTAGVLAHAPIELPRALSELELKELGREHSRYLHERARFTFQDERQTVRVLTEVREALSAEGWKISLVGQNDGERSVITGNKDNLRLTIGRWPAPKFQSYVAWSNGEEMPRPTEPICESPLLIVLESRFTDEELVVIADKSLEAPIDIDTVRTLQSILTLEHWQAIREHVTDNPRPFAADWLLLAEAHRKHDDREAAIEALRIAFPLAHMEGNGQVQSAKSLAKKLNAQLGEHSYYLNYERLVAANVTHLESATETTYLTLDRGQAARFFSFGPNSEPTVLTLRIQQLAPEITCSMEFRAGGNSMFTQNTLSSTESGTNGIWGVHFSLAAEVVSGKVELRIRRAE